MKAEVKTVAVGLLIAFAALYIYNKNYFGIRAKLGGPA